MEKKKKRKNLAVDERWITQRRRKDEKKLKKIIAVEERWIAQIGMDEWKKKKEKLLLYRYEE